MAQHARAARIERHDDAIELDARSVGVAPVHDRARAQRLPALRTDARYAEVAIVGSKSLLLCAGFGILVARLFKQ